MNFTFRLAVWLFPAAFILHVAEEWTPIHRLGPENTHHNCLLSETTTSFILRESLSP